jgi:hypothetical protein
MGWTLIIHEDPNWTSIIAGLLKQVVREEPVCVANLAQAQQQLEYHGRGRCLLIVSSATAPADAHCSRPVGGAPLRADDIRGQLATPCIILAAVNTGAASLGNAQNSRLLLLGDILGQLPTIARSLLCMEQGNAPKPPHEVDVDITITQGSCIWRMHGTPENPIDKMGTIQISPADMRRLLNDSARGEYASHDSVRQLGFDMYVNFMSDPVKSGLEFALSRHIRHPNLLEAARFHFHVDQEASQLLVETLAKPRDQNANAELDFWMRESPIFRKFGALGKRHPLFKDRLSRTTPINCLIIEGEVEDFHALGKNFPSIPMAARETDWLSNYLTENQKSFMLAPPKVMRASDFADGGYGDAVRSVLSATPWQLVHYVGHSAIGEDGKAYLALAGGAGDALDVDDFAACAREAQFVFLNSCHSANEKFIKKLIEKNIPAVAGYAWPINDEVASVFSKNFYTNLFEGTVSKRFLEYSFMRAKKVLHEKFTDQPVWTSPILFMQMLNPEKDEQQEVRRELYRNVG